MKRILLTLALAVLTLSANAQFFISANVGGNKFSGTTLTHTQISVVADIEYSDTSFLESTTSFTGGLKAGYKFGKAQVGVAGSYSMYNSIHQPLDPTLVPIIGNIMPNWVSSGEMSSHGSSFTVAPYFRYDVLTAGDVSLFIELSLFYTQMQNPTIDTAKVDNHMEVNGVPVVTSYFTWDTVGALVPRNSTTYGARVTPGLTWQLSKHCGIDLYLDFLSLAYSQTKSIDTRLDYNFRVSGTGTVTYDYTLTTVNTSSTDFGGALTGTPLLTKQGVNNWVRVGFNFTF